jgi:hypothetical protein
LEGSHFEISTKNLTSSSLAVFRLIVLVRGRICSSTNYRRNLTKYYSQLQEMFLRYIILGFKDIVIMGRAGECDAQNGLRDWKVSKIITCITEAGVINGLYLFSYTRH